MWASSSFVWSAQPLSLGCPAASGQSRISGRETPASRSCHRPRRGSVLAAGLAMLTSTASRIGVTVEDGHLTDEQHEQSPHSSGSRWQGLTRSLLVVAALIGEIEIACWFFGRMYGH